ncbi:hypothetical protein LTS18_013991, partial [Coniosporium uncinatum]
TSTGTSTPTPTPSPISPNNTGLSTGAKAGIGVAIGIIALAALVGLLLLMARRRKYKKPTMMEMDASRSFRDAKSPMIASARDQGYVEAPSGEVYEAAGDTAYVSQSNKQPAEMGTDGRAISELPAGELYR